MNGKSSLKVNNGLLYRTVSIKIEEVRVIYSVRRAGRAGVAGRQLRVSSLRVRTVEVVPCRLCTVREVVDPRLGGEDMHRT
jgi:hypothetical protein